MSYFDVKILYQYSPHLDVITGESRSFARRSSRIDWNVAENENVKGNFSSGFQVNVLTYVREGLQITTFEIEGDVSVTRNNFQRRFVAQRAGEPIKFLLSSFALRIVVEDRSE